MKRMLFLIAPILISLLLIGCADATVRFPEYTAQAVDCIFDLAVDGAAYRIRICRSPITVEPSTDFSHLTDAILTILAPDTLDGVTLILSEHTAHLCSGDLAIPVRREDLAGLLTLFACFSLENEAVIAIRTVQTSPDRTAAVYQSIHGTFTVLYDESLTPLSVEYTYEGHLYCLSNFLAFTGEN